MGAWIKFDLALGLYIYTRLSQLSIDRCQSYSQSEIIDFFYSEHIPLPHDVLREISKIKTESYLFFWPKIWPYMIKFSGLDFRFIWLNEEEILHIIKTLKRLIYFFDQGNFNTLEKNDVRLELAKTESNISKLLPKKYVSDGKNVKHLNHAPDLQLVKFSKLVPDSWLNVDK